MNKKKDKPFYLGASRNSTYNTCPQQYKYIYIDRRPTKQRDHHYVGSFCHEVLELWAKAVKGGIENTKDLFYICYKQALVGEYGEELSRLKELEAKKMLIKYYKNELSHFTSNILCVEKKFDISLMGNFRARGIIDRVDINKDNSIELIDYKTSKPSSLYMAKKNPIQIILYTYALLELYPHLKEQKIKSSYVALRKGGEKIGFIFTPSQISQGIEQICKNGRLILNDKEWIPKPSHLCNWCDFYKECYSNEKYWSFEV